MAYPWHPYYQKADKCFLVHLLHCFLWTLFSLFFHNTKKFQRFLTSFVVIGFNKLVGVPFLNPLYMASVLSSAGITASHDFNIYSWTLNIFIFVKHTQLLFYIFKRIFRPPFLNSPTDNNLTKLNRYSEIQFFSFYYLPNFTLK